MKKLLHGHIRWIQTALGTLLRHAIEQTKCEIALNHKLMMYAEPDIATIECPSVIQNINAHLNWMLRRFVFYQFHTNRKYQTYRSGWKHIG